LNSSMKDEEKLEDILEDIGGERNEGEDEEE
jgi:hypothetical protein